MSAHEPLKHHRAPHHFKAMAILVLGCLTVADVARAAPAPLLVERNNDLTFGSFVIVNNGNVTVDPTGPASFNNAFAVSGGSPAPARFTITGEPNADVRIFIPSVSIEQNISGVTATFSGFRATTSVGGPPPMSTMFDVKLPPTGSMTLFVGGNVAVARTTGSGIVSSSFPVTATYVN